MKTKRFLSVLVVLMMVLSCFAVTASAVPTTYSLKINLLRTTDEENSALDTTGDVDGDESGIGGQGIVDAEFKIYAETSAGSNTYSTEAAGTATTDSNGQASFTDLAKGRYMVVNTQKAPGTTAAYTTFYVDLPNTNVDGTGFINDVVVYPKQIVTGAVEITKTFNGKAPTGNTYAKFSLRSATTGLTYRNDNLVANAANGGVIHVNGLEFGTYKLYETEASAPFTLTVDEKEVATIIINAGGAYDTTSNKEVGTVVATTVANTTESVPQIDKLVSADGTNFGYSASISAINNSAATWKIESSLPADIADYENYVINDTIDERLIPDTSSLTVKIDNTDVKSLFNVTFANNKLSVSPKKFADMEQYAGKDIVMTFTTTIDLEQANTVATKIANHVDLSYTNAVGTSGVVNNHDNDDTPDGSTSDNYDPANPTNPAVPGSDKDPYIWTGKLEADKVSTDATTTRIANAQFKLFTDANCTTAVKNAQGADIVVTTTADASFTFTGLAAGTYYLKETKAAAKYELLDTPITVVISEDAMTFSRTIANNNPIANRPSTDLPLTGGMGTALFLTLGLALIGFGGVSFIKSKKVSE